MLLAHLIYWLTLWLPCVLRIGVCFGSETI